VNVICVDWGQLAFAIKDTYIPMYLSAVRNVQPAGIRVGELLIKLFELGIIKSPKLVHLIGFSLGSHVAGQAGNTFYKRTSAYLRRITGTA